VHAKDDYSRCLVLSAQLLLVRSTCETALDLCGFLVSQDAPAFHTMCHQKKLARDAPERYEFICAVFGRLQITTFGQMVYVPAASLADYGECYLMKISTRSLLLNISCGGILAHSVVQIFGWERLLVNDAPGLYFSRAAIKILS